MIGFQFRRAELADEPELFRVLTYAIDDSRRRNGWTGPDDPPPNDERIAAEFQHVVAYTTYASGVGETWLAENDDRIVGYARVIRWPPAAELTEAMILPGYQDKGLGARLLERAFGIRRPDSDELRVIWANPTSQAVGLYTRFGVAPIQMIYTLSVDKTLAPNAMEEPTKGLRTEPLSLDFPIDRFDDDALAFARNGLHRCWLVDGDRTGVAVFRNGEPIGYCYQTPGFGPAAARTPGDLISVLAAGLRDRDRDKPTRINLTGATDQVWRWLEQFHPRFVSFAALCANRAMPGLDRYILADPGYTI